MEPWTPLFSYLAFAGFGASVALVVLTLVLGRNAGAPSALSWGVGGFGLAYGLWSLASVFLWAQPRVGPLELWTALATLGMFGFPVASLVITMALGRLPRRLKASTVVVVGAYAAAVVVWSIVGHRFYPGVSAFSLDGSPLGVGDRALPWTVFGINGVGFGLGAYGMFRARAGQESQRLRRQVGLVLVQLAAGLGGYVAASLAEVIWDLPRVGMVTLLYPLGLNFYLIWKYRYLRFDLPTLGPEIIDHLGEAVFLLDPRGTILKANPAAGRIFPERGGLTGESFRGLFDEPGAVDAAWRSVLTSGQRGEFPGLKLGGAQGSLNLAPYLDGFGDLVGMVAVVDRADAFEAAASRLGLTNREKEVALLLVRGLSVREMAEASFVSEATIKTHLVHLYRKSGATNRVTFLQKILQNR